MKVCHLLDNVRPGVGVTEVIYGLMTDERLECRGICIRRHEVDVRLVRLVQEGAVIETGSLAAVCSALLRMRVDGCRILHVHSRKAVAACVFARMLGYTVVRTQHFGTPMAPQPCNARAKLATVRNFLTLRTWWINHWAAISETSRTYLLSRWNIPEERISVIYNGIDLSRFTPLTKSQILSLRSRFGWDQDWIVLISVGALVARKRHAKIIEEFAVVTKECPDARLFIVGEGSERRRLEALISGLGLDDRVTLLGLSNDVPGLLAASDICVHAALDEAFGLVVAEGMAAGLPLIVVDSMGPAEIAENGISGLVVPPDEPSGMAEAMLRLISNAALRSAMGLAARDRATRRFSLAAMRDSYHALYESHAPSD